MAWYDEARFYHIYPLGLLDAPKENNYGEVVHRLKELDGWIAHIKKTGFNAIYIGPLFESVGHGYETTDYKKLDSRLGSNEDLKEFVKKCHDLDIKVIFDGVFNHTGRDFFAFQDIRKNRENSRYRDWYCNVNFGGNTEYNDGFSYENWGGYNLLVKLNQRNPEVRDYICDVIRFWVDEFDVDGIRLDAADVLDFEYMRMLRTVANEVKPDFWLMGEVIHGDYTKWVNEKTLHSVTNYVLHKALYSGHNDHNYFEIAHTVTRLYEMGGNRPDGLKLYNFVDNHDVERIYTKLNNKAHFMPVHILLYTLPGIPSVYYGSEFGIEGRKEKYSDASLRPALKYEEYKEKENPCIKLITALNQIRGRSLALSYGDYKQLLLTNRQYVFSRTYQGKMAVVAVNNDDAPSTISCGGIIDGTYTGTLSGEKITVTNGNLSLTIPPNFGEILLPLPSENEVDETEGVAANLGITAMTNEVETKESQEKAETSQEETVNPTICPETLEEKTTQPEEPVVTASEEVSVQTETAPAAPKQIADTKAEDNSIEMAGKKYGIGDKYDTIDPAKISARTDYEQMSIEELQVAILEKMAKNGPVNEQMIKTVMDNIYPDSLKNWVRSF